MTTAANHQPCGPRPDLRPPGHRRPSTAPPCALQVMAALGFPRHRNAAQPMPAARACAVGFPSAPGGTR